VRVFSWEETFQFNILAEHTSLHFKIFDKDTFSADDLMGQNVVN
jgi:hypothetical protein